MACSLFVTLNRTKDKMPLIGFGTFRLSNEEAESAVYNAICAGARLIDCAIAYHNEEQVGKGVRRAINEGVVERKDLFIVGKLWNHYHAKANVRPAFDITLKNFGLDYLDLYIIHIPIATKYIPINDQTTIPLFDHDFNIVLERSPMHECWKEMENLVDSGLVRNIGLSNFNVQSILDVLTYCKYRPSVLETEHHPYFQQKRLINWAKAQDIQIIGFNSFGATAFSGVIPKALAGLPSLFNHPIIQKIADKHHCDTTAQVLLRWAVQKNIAIIPKSSNVERMKLNVHLDYFNLDKEDLDEIETMEASFHSERDHLEPEPLDSHSLLCLLPCHEELCELKCSL
ncbi:xylose reductase [Backusella circina FSU 941]|nr:xylose reductase [Backusella circina FSU 941]